MLTITVAMGPQSNRPSTPTSSQSSLPIRSSPARPIPATPTTPERPRPRRTPTLEASPLPASTYQAPSSTAPPALGRGKRKKPHTRKYAESRAQGEIAESQEAHKAERQGWILLHHAWSIQNLGGEVILGALGEDFLYHTQVHIVGWECLTNMCDIT